MTRSSWTDAYQTEIIPGCRDSQLIYYNIFCSMLSDFSHLVNWSVFPDFPAIGKLAGKHEKKISHGSFFSCFPANFLKGGRTWKKKLPWEFFSMFPANFLKGGRTGKKNSHGRFFFHVFPVRKNFNFWLLKVTKGATKLPNTLYFHEFGM